MFDGLGHCVFHPVYPFFSPRPGDAKTGATASHSTCTTGVIASILLALITVAVCTLAFNWSLAHAMGDGAIAGDFNVLKARCGCTVRLASKCPALDPRYRTPVWHGLHIYYI